MSEGALSFGLTLALVLALSSPVLTTARSPLTSDESLYAAEALNIQRGAGLTYPTGAPITHRAPLFPAVLAAAFSIDGVSLDAASWASRLATVANAVLAALLARRLAGPVAGVVAGVAAASSAYLNVLGASLFLDPVQTTFVLSALLLFWEAASRGSGRLHFAAGVALGLAVLTKESAIQLAPLPLVFVLVGGTYRGWRSGLAMWAAGLTFSAGWWWAWVFAQTHSVYLLGDVASSEVQVAAGALALGGAFFALALAAWGGRLDPRPGRWQAGAGVAFLTVWGVATVVGLEWQSWDHPQRYLTDVPAYLADVAAPAMPAFPLMAAALVWASLRGLFGDRSAAFISCAAMLLVPFLAFAANRELSLRDAAPFLYAGVVALGCASAWLLEWGIRLSRSQDSSLPARAGAAVLVVAVAAIALQGLGRVERGAEEGAVWEAAAAGDTAAWLQANVPPGTPVMSTRLYYSQVYFLAGGRYPVHQVPTILVEPEAGKPGSLRARSTLFRWEALPERQRQAWTYLGRFPGKGYYIGLAEEDLLADIRERGVEYVVVNVTDATFSPPSLIAYMDSSPGFVRVDERSYGGEQRTVIYRVDHARLGPRAAPLAVTAYAYEGLLEQVGGDEAAVTDYLRGLNPAGAVLTR